MLAHNALHIDGPPKMHVVLSLRSLGPYCARIEGKRSTLRVAKNHSALQQAWPLSNSCFESQSPLSGCGQVSPMEFTVGTHSKHISWTRCFVIYSHKAPVFI